MKFIKLLNDQGVIYGSYRDFWSLVELSGFETVDQNSEWLNTDDTYIVSINNGNAAIWAQMTRKCKLILWQLERWLGTAEEYAPRIYDEVWISDRWQANELRSRGFDHVRYVPLGSHAGLGGKSEAKQYDLAPMCYMHGKREDYINSLKRQYRIAPTCWPPQRDEVLAASRAGLCLHQWGHAGKQDLAVEILRAAIFCAWKLPMVFAPCNDYFPYQVYSLDEIDLALVDARKTAQQNFDLLCGSMCFANCVNEAIGSAVLI